MALVTEFQKYPFQNKSYADQIAMRESQLISSNGKNTPLKPRSNISPAPDMRQAPMELSYTEGSNKQRARETNKTSSEFYVHTKKKSSVSEERDSWNQINAGKSHSINSKIVNMRIEAAFKKAQIDRKVPTGVRASSMVRPREYIDQQVSEYNERMGVERLSSKGPLIRSGKFAVTGSESGTYNYTQDTPISQSNYGTRTQPGQLQPDLANIQLQTKQRSPHATKETKSRDQIKTGHIETQTEASGNIMTPVKVKELNEQKKLPAVEERKKRVDALEKLVEHNYPNNSQTELYNAETSNSFEPQPIKQKKEVLPPDNPKIPEKGNHQNFRKNIYKSPPIERPNIKMLDTPDDPLKVAGSTSNQNSGNKEIENLKNEQIDIEEMHYFFVNFHQKSRQLMSKLK